MAGPGPRLTGQMLAPPLRKRPNAGVASGAVRRCLGGCVLFTVAASVRGVMLGVGEAATLAVYRQIAALFTAARASLGASEPQSCSSFPSRNHQGEQ